MEKCSNGDVTIKVAGRTREIQYALHRLVHKRGSWNGFRVLHVFIVVALAMLLFMGSALAQRVERIEVQFNQTEVNGDMDFAVPLPQWMPYPHPMEIQNLSVKNRHEEELSLETVKEIGVRVREKQAALHFVLSGKELRNDIWVSLSAKVRFPLVPLKVFAVMQRTNLQEKWIVAMNLTRRVPELPVELFLRDHHLYPPLIRFIFGFVAVDRNWLTLGREQLMEQDGQQKMWNRWELTVRDSRNRALATRDFGVLSYSSYTVIDVTERNGDKLDVLQVSAVGTIEDKQFTFKWEVSKSPAGKWVITKWPDYGEVLRKGMPVP